MTEPLPLRREFPTWREARAYAEHQARAYQLPFGIEKPTAYSQWTVKMLPNKANRYGWERMCEAVEPW